jgi:hypothetical protein
VAIKTPVPKCLQKKKIGGGIFIHLTFFATTGNPAPPIEAAKTMTVWLLLDGNILALSGTLTDCSYVQREVIVCRICITATHWLLHRGHCDRNYYR